MSPGSSIRISLKINGRDHEFPATACDTLLDVLRDKLGMTGTKKGCDIGSVRCMHCVGGGPPDKILSGACGFL